MKQGKAEWIDSQCVYIHVWILVWPWNLNSPMPSLKLEVFFFSFLKSLKWKYPARFLYQFYIFLVITIHSEFFFPQCFVCYYIYTIWPFMWGRMNMKSWIKKFKETSFSLEKRDQKSHNIVRLKTLCGFCEAVKRLISHYWKTLWFQMLCKHLIYFV